MRRVVRRRGAVRIDLPKYQLRLPTAARLGSDGARDQLDENVKALRALPTPWSGFARWLAPRMRKIGNSVEFPDSSAVERMQETVGLPSVIGDGLDKTVQEHVNRAIIAGR